MGQYQQWLYAQEMDRRLRAEVESLETELLYLKDRVAILEQTLPETENVILHALLVYQRDQENQASARMDSSGSGPLSRWDNLPDAETPRPPAGSTAPYYFGLRSQQGLKPENMLTLFEQREHAYPAPWQHRSEERPIDTEIRTQNENIQRWFEIGRAHV